MYVTMNTRLEGNSISTSGYGSIKMREQIIAKKCIMDVSQETMSLRYSLRGEYCARIVSDPMSCSLIEAEENDEGCRYHELDGENEVDLPHERRTDLFG